MAYLFDTNVFLRLARRNDPQRQLALEALRTLFWNHCRLSVRCEMTTHSSIFTPTRTSVSLRWRFSEILVMFYRAPE